jgi:acetyl-CoA carboxylase carboxyltransferase component
VLELRREFGIGIVTALIRVEGKPFGLIANNPRHLGGAIDSDAADKGARFLQLCDNFGIPIVSLCDTPGIMVGPEAEKTALVRHASRLLVTGANLTVPMFAVVLRKGYGIGRIAMLGGNNRLPFFCVSWPTGEFGGMNLEGAVKLGFRKELAAIADPAERLKKYEAMVAEMYRKGRALTAATDLAVDDVIDPMETRQWIMMGWMATRGEYGRPGRSYIDAW